MQTQINMQLVTNELSIKNNHLSSGTFNVNPRFQRNIGIVDEKHSFTQIIVELRNSKENPFPVDIKADMTAIFDMSTVPAEKADDFLKHQAVHILMPYIRGMISSATANALMTPIVLPVFDATTLFQD